MAGWGPFDLTGKNAVVTGAARGIGLGVARRVAEAGARVLMVDVLGEAVQAAARDLAADAAGVVAMQADLGQDGVGEAIVARCVEQFGSIDILVNNAGIYPRAMMMETTYELYERIFRINVKGLMFSSKAAAERMIDRGQGGKIVNVASIGAWCPLVKGLVAYDASKGAVVGFTKSFALEMAPYGIRVNAVAPGTIATEGAALMGGSDQRPPDQRAQAGQGILARIPLGRMGMPDDIAKAAVFLASSASDWMAGEVLVVDGGVQL